MSSIDQQAPSAPAEMSSMDQQAPLDLAQDLQAPKDPTEMLEDAQEQGSGADAEAIKDLQKRMQGLTSSQISEKLPSLTEPSMERALVAFASDKNLSGAELAAVDVENSGEGIAYWACKGLNMKAASPLGQTFTRALKHMDAAVKETYLALNDSLKERFRSKYLMDRKWDFVHERKIRTVEHCKVDKKIGEYMNFINLANSYGGYQFEEAREEAQVYADFARHYGPPMVTFDPVTKKENFLRIKKLVETTNKESWQAITESAVTENLWESLAAECRAKRSFAAHHGMRLPIYGQGSPGEGGEGSSFACRFSKYGFLKRVPWAPGMALAKTTV